MENCIFIKKHWEESNILYYVHFADGVAERQIEISPSGKRYLSKKNPVKGDSSLYDQHLNELDLRDGDFISKQEFEDAWKEGEEKGQ